MPVPLLMCSRFQDCKDFKPEERGLDTTPAALLGRSTGGSGPPVGLEVTDLLVGRKVSGAPLSTADGTAVGLPQPNPGGSGAIASQPKPGGIAGGSRGPLLTGVSDDSAGVTGAAAAAGCLSIRIGSALMVFVS